MSVNKATVQQYYPDKKVVEADGKVKMHLEVLTTEDIANLYKIAEPDHRNGTFTHKLQVKRSGTGLTVIFE